MARRYYRVPLDFWHEPLCDRLLAELGPWGPVVWLSLEAEAKRSHLKGTLVVPSEVAFWQALGLYGHEHRMPPFTMTEFLKVTGRMKETRREKVGRLIHIIISRYADRQLDWEREDARHRQDRQRQKGQQTSRTSVTRGSDVASTSLTEGVTDTPGDDPEHQQTPRKSATSTRDTPRDAHRDRSRSREREEESRTRDTHNPKCPLPDCQLDFPTWPRVRDHLVNVHWLNEQQVNDLLPDPADSGPAA